MKKIRSFWHIAMVVWIGAAALSLASCGDDDDKVAPFLEVDEFQISFSAGGGSKVFSVKSNTSWTIVGNEEWLSVSPSSGSGNQTITLTAKSNSSSESKNSVLEIRSTDGSVSQRVNVEIAGVNATLSVSSKSITFGVTQGDIQHFTITCNTAWTISGQPEWLDMYPSAGNGTSSIELKTLYENTTSSKPRTATLVITAGDKQETVDLVQVAGLASNCSVRPNEITTLCNGIAFDCSYDPNVSFFYAGWMEADEVASMTEAEIVTALEDRFTRRLPSDDPIVVFDKMEADTEYMVYTLGCTKDGIRGDLYSERISTNKALNNEPMAFISNFSYDDDYWYYNIKRNGTCSYYYLFSWQSDDIYSYSDVLIAWLIDEGIRLGDYESPITNDTSVRSKRNKDNPVMNVWTRGYNMKDVASGRLSYGRDWIGSSTSPKRTMERNKPTPKVQFFKKPVPGSYKIYRMK